MRKILIPTVIIMIVMAFVQFSDQSTSGNNCNNAGTPQTISKDKGIGPFQNLTMAPIDKNKVKAGMTIFNSKCILCHELDTKKVGPPLRNIVKDYTPEFILNMMANPLEMQKSDPIVKNLLKQFNNVPMPDQKISQQDALNILDYLRSVVK
jgi:cytochrome c551/c552